MNDKYVNDMDWGSNGVNLSALNNYRKYQFDLISSHLGESILEVGSGDRSFTDQIVKNHPSFERLLSIEPSSTLFNLYKDRVISNSNVSFKSIDLFDLDPAEFGQFDTIVMVHVLEHIEDDYAALEYLHSLLKPNGKILIIVPSLQWLFSDHDVSLGHYRRYNKKMLLNLVNDSKYKIRKLWYQDPLGILGSLIYFKFKKIKIKSHKGELLMKKQGIFYEKYLIPFISRIERYITFPIGLSLTMVLEKK